MQTVQMYQCRTGKRCCVKVKVLMGRARFQRGWKKSAGTVSCNRVAAHSRELGIDASKIVQRWKDWSVVVVQNMLWVIGAHGLDNSTWGQPFFLKITPTDISSSLSLLLSFSGWWAAQQNGIISRTLGGPQCFQPALCGWIRWIHPWTTATWLQVPLQLSGWEAFFTAQHCRLVSQFGPFEFLPRSPCKQRWRCVMKRELQTRTACDCICIL